MEHLLENPETWVLVAFVIFVALVVKKTSPLITSALDERAIRIRDELEETTRLREEAQNLLARYQRQQRGVKSEAEAMIERARRDSKLMMETATARLAEQLVLREKQARQNIERAEAQVVDEIRAAAAELAIATAEQLIIQNLDESRANALINHSIKGLGPQLS